MKDRILNPKSAALLVVDIQEAFRKSIAELDEVIRKTSAAIRGFESFDCPVFITEQYPKGLGHTVVDLLEAGKSNEVFEKSGFDCLSCRDLADRLAQSGIRQVAVAGIETHVCVNQTVHSLLLAGYSVHILEDAVASRHESDRDTGLKKMYLSGAVPSTVEMALFEMLADSADPKFKEIQNLIK